MKQFSLSSRTEIAIILKNINGFLGSISLESRVIFIRRYWFCDTYAEIASRYGISERKVKHHIQEIREHMCIYLGRTWGSFGINYVDAKFVREAEDAVYLRERKLFLCEYSSTLYDLVDFVLRRFLRFPKHA